MQYTSSRRSAVLMACAAGILFATRARAKPIRIRPDSNGCFYLKGAINGRPYTFLLDTGCSGFVGLSDAHAAQLGLRVVCDSYVETANGRIRSGHVKLTLLEVGDMLWHNMDAGVSKGEMSEVLLGVDFLSSMGGLEIRNGILVLNP